MNRWAVAKPIPLLPPVTTATLLFNLLMVSFPFSLIDWSKFGQKKSTGFQRRQRRVHDALRHRRVVVHPCDQGQALTDAHI